MSSYTKTLDDKICTRIAQGKSLVKVCNELQIEYRYVFDWLKENKEFSDNYTRAREDQADFHADELLDIADDESIPADSRRIRVDARKWKAGKMKPKKYGDSTQLKHADADGNKLTLGMVLGEINGRTADLPRAEEIPE